MKRLITILCLVLTGFINLSYAAQPTFLNDDSVCRQLMDDNKYAEAFATCSAAAAKGDASAQFNLSVIYSNGWGVTKNEEQSLKWLISSSDQHYPPAEYAMASHYATGKGVSKSSSESMKLLSNSASQGFILAQVMLARAYESGYQLLKISKDKHKALNWYTKAAEHCDACMYELWRFYYFGLGVPKAPEKAVQYLKLSASGGLPKAQMQLAFYYHKGEVVTKDYKRAYSWFYLAELGGNATAKKALPLLAKKMSHSEIVQARETAKALLAQQSVNTAQLCSIYQEFCNN